MVLSARTEPNTGSITVGPNPPPKPLTEAAPNVESKGMYIPYAYCVIDANTVNVASAVLIIVNE